MNEIDITLNALAEKVKILIQKNKDLYTVNEKLQMEYNKKTEELENEINIINNKLSEEEEKRQKDKETIRELIREIDECLKIYSK